MKTQIERCHVACGCEDMQLDPSSETRRQEGRQTDEGTGRQRPTIEGRISLYSWKTRKEV